MPSTMVALHAPRLALLRDGTSVGCFTTRSHETYVVVLEPNGHAYTYAAPSGRLSRHLTPTLLSAHREMVAATLRFRNRFAWCAVDAQDQPKLPYLHSVVGDTASGAVHSRRRKRQSCGTACWPRLDAYATSRLWNDCEKRFEMESLDGTARVALHASGKLVDVQYLLKVKRDEEDSSSSEELCAWVKQSFAVASTPACFAWPVRVLLDARIARGSHAESFRVEVEEPSDALSTVTLPANGAFDARPTFRPLFHDASSIGTATYTAIATHAKNADTTPSVDAVVRWAKGLSRSLDGWIAVEQSLGVELLVVNEPSMPLAVLIMTTETDTETPSRRSVVECERGFFRAFDADGSVAQQFTVETLPLELKMLSLSRDFQQTTAILQHAAELFQAAATTVQPSQQPDEQDEFPTTATTEDGNATQQLEDVSNELGRFRAFADGRVRVVFADRTILQVSPSTSGAEDCSFMDREGSSSRCTSDSASEAQQRYITMATDFAQWAFATPEQRFRRYQLQQEQQRLVEQELHKITIRQELNRNAEARGSIRLVTRKATEEESLSPEAIARLQQETHKHMTHIRTLLHGEQNAADTHRD